MAPITPRRVGTRTLRPSAVRLPPRGLRADARPKNGPGRTPPASPRLGSAPWLPRVAGGEPPARACAAAGARRAAVDPVLFDAFGRAPPAPPLGPVTLQDV